MTLRINEKTREAPTARFGLGRSGEGLVAREGGMQEQRNTGTGQRASARYELVTGSVFVALGLLMSISSFANKLRGNPVTIPLMFAGIALVGIGATLMALPLGGALAGVIGFLAAVATFGAFLIFGPRD